jgi:hypothetical protein
MDQLNSSLTRVQPILDALRQRDSSGSTWLPELWRMASATRGVDAISPPPDFGLLVPGKGYQRVVPPSTPFLRWAIQNPQQLSSLPDFGASGDAAKTKRATLFGPDEARRTSVVAEALAAIDALTGKGSAQQWWAFEGFTHVDACLETSGSLIVVEGKNTETAFPSTRWFQQRTQLWRNVEVAQELAAGRQFGVILGVETAESGRVALRDAEATRDGSYPHLNEIARAELDRHLLGFVVWSEIVSAFGLPPSVLLQTSDRASPSIS